MSHLGSMGIICRAGQVANWSWRQKKMAGGSLRRTQKPKQLVVAAQVDFRTGQPRGARIPQPSGPLEDHAGRQRRHPGNAQCGLVGGERLDAGVVLVDGLDHLFDGRRRRQRRRLRLHAEWLEK